MPPSKSTPAKAPQGSAVLRALRSIRDFFTGFFALIVTTVVFFILLSVSSYYTVGYFIRGEEVIAPDVTGRTVTEALETLKERNLMLDLERSEPSDALDAGMILRQRPRAASRVKTRTQVRVVVSSGPRMTTLPGELLGLSQAEAGIELRRLGLNVGNVSYLEAEGKEPDSVLAFDPPVGTGLLPGMTVNLLVSSGTAGAPRPMPNLYGLTSQEATAQAERYGLDVTISNTGRDASAAPGTVESQSVPAGTSVRPDQRVNLVIRSTY